MPTFSVKKEIVDTFSQQRVSQAEEYQLRSPCSSPQLNTSHNFTHPEKWQLIMNMSTILFELISTLSSPDEAGQAVDQDPQQVSAISVVEWRPTIV